MNAERNRAAVGVTVAIIVSVILWVLIVFGLLMALSSTDTPPLAPAPTMWIQEDDPSWDCHTMGNHICGGDQP